MRQYIDRHLSRLLLLVTLYVITTCSLAGQDSLHDSTLFNEELISGIRLGLSPFTPLIGKQKQIQLNGGIHLGGRYTLSGTLGVYPKFMNGHDLRGLQSRLIVSRNSPLFNNKNSPGSHSDYVHYGIGLAYRRQSAVATEVYERFGGSFFEEIDSKVHVDHLSIPVAVGILSRLSNRVYLDMVLGITLFQTDSYDTESLPSDAALISDFDCLLVRTEDAYFNFKLQYRLY